MKKLVNKVMEHKVIAGCVAGATVVGVGTVLVVRKLRNR